jgi:hypothetical protein
MGGAPLVFVHGMRHAVPADVACSMHSHREIEIVYHRAGSGVTRLDGGRTIPFKEGSVVVYAPDERHDQVMDCKGEDLCVQLAIPEDSNALRGSCFEIPADEDATLIEDILYLSRGLLRGNSREQPTLLRARREEVEFEDVVASLGVEFGESRAELMKRRGHPARRLAIVLCRRFTPLIPTRNNKMTPASGLSGERTRKGYRSRLRLSG